MVKRKVKVQLCFPIPSTLVHIHEEKFCPISRFKFGGNMYSTRLPTTEGGESGSSSKSHAGKPTTLIKAKLQYICHIKAGVHLPVLKKMTGP